MKEQGQRPEILGVVRQDGILQLDVTPVTAAAGLRNRIDTMRNSGLNLMPGGVPGGFEIRVAHSQEDALLRQIRAYGNLTLVCLVNQAT